MASANFHLIFLIVLAFPIATNSQKNGNVTVGASLTAEETSATWLSPSGDFAFGFQKLQNMQDSFLLAIWFDKIPEKTICWYQSSSYPVRRGSTVQLNAESGLILRDPQGQFVWSTSVSSGEIGYGFLNDTGNFVLSGISSNMLWETFRNPTDTLLPTQTIEIGEMLVSKRSETNFSPGRFSARMLDNGNFVFSTKSLQNNSVFDDEYYSSSTLDSGLQVVFNESALFIRRRNEQPVVLSPASIPPALGNYYRATSNFDGVFTQYYHPKNFNGNPGWTAVESWPDNICLSVDGVQGSGACGYYSVCRLANKRPICECPPGFLWADPNYTYSDCMPVMPFSSCIVSDYNNGLLADAFQFMEIVDTDWPMSDYEQTTPSTEDECKASCLSDCFCNVAIYRSNTCWKKRLPLSNGRIDITLNVKAFFKLRKVDFPFINRTFEAANSPKDDKKTLIIVGSTLLGSSVFLNFLLITAAFLGFFLVYRRKISIYNMSIYSTGSNLRCFTYKELEEATAGFGEELGRGAFAIVYKGVLPNASKTAIAVKKMNIMARDPEKEFRAEVNAIGHTHHKNLVRLLGFCDEGPHHLLVYEFMSNGTLASFLFGDKKPSWSQRTEIAIGIARGLTYLHEECSKQTIHCDIKPQNILLDEYYNARISDFGLAKLLMINQSRTLTNIRGTKGYFAPEWLRNTQITAKVDVYSFGVVLMEIITCRRSLEDVEIQREGLSVLTDQVLDCFEDRRLDILVGNDVEALKDMGRLERFVKAGIWCIQDDPCLRPTMKKVCQMLEGIVEVEEPPCPY